MSFASIVRASATSPPLDPSQLEARQQLQQELQHSEYRAAQPGFFETLSQEIGKWLQSLLSHFGAPTGSPSFNFLGTLGDIALVLLVFALLVVAFFLFGLPRINRKGRKAGSLFGDEDERDSQTLLKSAERAAAAGDFTTAIEDGFRSIARGLAERAIVITFPGTTAHGFAAQAGAAFPGFTPELAASADVFDRVRYLGKSGSREGWQSISDLERALRSGKPLLEEASA
jgi:Domain of unknown function (DUF4129)